MKIRQFLVDNYSDLRKDQVIASKDKKRVLSGIDVFDDIQTQLTSLAENFISESSELQKVLSESYDNIDDYADNILVHISGVDNKRDFKKQCDRLMDGYIRNYGNRLYGGY